MRVGRIIAWVAVVLVGILAFVRTGSPVLLVLLLAAVLLPLVGWGAAALAARRVNVQLASPTTASKGAAVRVQASFANDSRLPLAQVRADMAVRNLLTGRESLVPVAVALPPRSQVEVPVNLTSDFCGRIECTVRSVRLFDPFRMFCRSMTSAAERRLTVMPDLHEAHLRDVYAASPLSDTTVFSPYVRGSDLSEVFGLREYEEGDELRRIHWKLSEKIDQMIVRDASLPLDNALLLFWDKGLPAGAGTGAAAGGEAAGANASASAEADDTAPRADAMAEVALAMMEQLAQADVTFEVASNDIADSRCTRAFVTDESDIYEIIGQLLSSPLAPAAESGLAEYVRFFGDLTCSRLLYLCSQIPYNLETLLGNREAIVLVCDGSLELVQRQQVIEVHFQPGGARAALEMLGVV